MYYSIWTLAVFFALACSFIDAQNISLTKEKRTLAVQQMYARIREPERVRRRRLGEALEEENIMDILEAFEYHLELSKQSLMLRSIGVKEEDGLPATMNDTAMTSGLGDAMKSLSMHLMHEEEHASARRLKERKRRLSQEKYDKIHHILRKTSAAVYEEPIRKPAKPRYLGEISEGVHEIDISGGAVRSSRNGRKLADLDEKCPICKRTDWNPVIIEMNIIEQSLFENEKEEIELKCDL
eukprot:Stramenopile-MAST_4_protein_3227